MNGGLVFGLGLLFAGLAVVLSGLAHWNRWVTPRGPIEPGSSAGRAYVYLPGGLGAFAVGVWFSTESVGLSLPDAVSIPLIAVAGVGFLLSPVGIIWQPERLRPRWQRERIDRFRRRQDMIATGRRQGHHLLVLLTYGDDEEPVATSDDLEVATEVARTAFAEDPVADVATVLDLDRKAIASRIDRHTA
ncbi:MAG: hypothetical protein JJT89_11280 [Nitriliruptoraceae bacterium]|nr:hypothetical protein [Nitriliruptoraceae bacterium]